LDDVVGDGSGAIVVLSLDVVEDDLAMSVPLAVDDLVNVERHDFGAIAALAVDVVEDDLVLYVDFEVWQKVCTAYSHGSLALLIEAHSEDFEDCCSGRLSRYEYDPR
jgi:hypothetical protein